jgi:hypothetical protein
MMADAPRKSRGYAVFQGFSPLYPEEVPTGTGFDVAMCISATIEELPEQAGLPAQAL